MVSTLYKTCLLAIGIVSACFQLIYADVTTNDYTIASPPAWVKTFPVRPPETLPKNAISSGTYYLLSDTQVQKAQSEGQYYYHYALKVMNRNGLEASSQIAVNFDPTYQDLILHSIVVHRDGRMIDKLNAAKIDILQREQDLEWQIFDGTKTFNAILNDIRVGDILEYAYTLQGDNPVFNGMFAQSIRVQYNAPVKQLYHRILWDKQKPLHITYHKTEIEPQVTEHRSHMEYEYHLNNLPPLILDRDLPDWYNPYPWIDFSSTRTWDEIIPWGLRLFHIPTELSPELQNIINDISRQHDNDAERITAALRFVQDNIRYMAIFTGLGSHKPNSPNIVIERRFGDCKDKSLLLCTMLQRMGITAYPALVNTVYKEHIRDWIPSPTSFNHVITKITHKGRTYWVDPTRNYQRGTLSHLSQSRYGVALILQPGVNKLETMPPPDMTMPYKDITETCYLYEDKSHPVRFNAKTVYRDCWADYIRSQFETRSYDEMARAHLNYYATLYPDIISLQNLRTEDDVTNNTFTVYEYYDIPNFWKTNDKTGRLEGNFEAMDISSAAGIPHTIQRTMPLRVTYPAYYREKIEIFFPEAWNVNTNGTRIEDDAIVYASTVNQISPRQTEWIYTFRSTKDFLPAREAQEHIEHLTKIQNDARLAVYDNPGHARIHAINWSLIVIIVLIVVIMMYLAWKVYHYNPPARGPVSAEPEGLGGWLVLAMIGLIISPFVLIYTLGQMYPMLTNAQWHALANPATENYHILWQPVILFEVTTNIFSFIFSIMILFLFFGQRSSFPRVYITLQVTIFCLLLVDHLVSSLLPGIDNMSQTRDLIKLIQTGVFSLFWILYMLKSERVKNTFIRRRKQRRPGITPPPLP